MLKFLRWLAVLPASLFSNIMSSLILSLLYPVLVYVLGIRSDRSAGLLGPGLVQDPGFFDTYLVDFVTTALPAFLFVFVGAQVAPNHRSHAAVGLTALYIAGVVAAMCLYSNPNGPIQTVILLSGHIVGAAVAVAQLFNQERAGTSSASG